MKHEPSPGMPVILLTRLNRDPNDTRRILTALDGREEELALKAYRSERARLLHYLGRLLLGYGLAQICDFHAPYTIKLHKKGRPVLRCDRVKTSINFSISHSGEYVGVAFSNRGRIGLDIEDLGGRPFNSKRADAIARGCFSPDEYTRWRRTAPFRRKELFYMIWTLKESRAKCDGTGIDPARLKDTVFHEQFSGIRRQCARINGYEMCTQRKGRIRLALCRAVVNSRDKTPAEKRPAIHKIPIETVLSGVERSSRRRT